MTNMVMDTTLYCLMGMWLVIKGNDSNECLGISLAYNKRIMGKKKDRQRMIE